MLPYGQESNGDVLNGIGGGDGGGGFGHDDQLDGVTSGQGLFGGGTTTNSSSINGTTSTGGNNNNNNTSSAFCASCDRCRSRKTKCDGKRPCTNCISKYMKKYKISSTEGIPLEAFDCVYSLAKRRGPVPGKASGSTPNNNSNGRRNSLDNMDVGSMNSDESPTQEGGRNTMVTPTTSNNLVGGIPHNINTVLSSSSPLLNNKNNNNLSNLSDAQLTAALLQAQQIQQIQQQLQNHQQLNADSTGAFDNTNLQQQINALQQMQQQQQLQQQQRGGDDTMNPSNRRRKTDDSTTASITGSNSAVPIPPQQQRRTQSGSSVRAANASGAGGGTTGTIPGGVPRTIMTHTHLLDRNDPEGSRLRAYYKLSIDELFCLPVTPTDEEYCARLNIIGLIPSMIPGTHLAALSAARFAEAALGAIVHNEVTLATELCNAVVHCLRECVQEPVQTPILFEVAKSYFLLGVFRAFRGDMVRYFKYRRVALTYVAKLGDNADSQILLSAVSYLDAWAYMIYNANEKALPDVDDVIPPPKQQQSDKNQQDNAGNNNRGACLDITAINEDIERKYNIRTDLQSIACDPKNKNWIQGAPPVYLNNEAPLRARALDALACAVRSCCDQANGRFLAIAAAAAESGESNTGESCGVGGACQPTEDPAIPQESVFTPTATAVLANENELCSRNLVLSAFALMQQHDNTNPGHHTRHAGQHLVISAMDAFLENSDDGGSGGFSDSQIQSLLSVCNTVLENPLLLHHAGPTYHMVSNAAVLLCHFLNGMHAMKASNLFGTMESVMFDEALDTLIAIRKLLTIHRRKLPVKLRCHGIPRPTMNAQNGQPFIDLGETLLCVCRGCQGFVLMACSPCVAAERARSAANRIEVAAAQEAEAFEMNNEFGLGYDSSMALDFGSEFNLDDDALLGMISSLISS